MSRPLELDFFGMERNNSTNNSSVASVTTAVPNTASKKPQFDRRLSFRGIQNAISKINPEVLKSVISSGTAPSTPLPQSAKPSPLLPEPQKNSFPTLPEFRATYGDGTGVPMTIFYNGSVSVFNVSPDKAEDIIKFATDGNVKNGDALPPPSVNNHPNNFFGVLSGDLPMARKKSLQRFFEKRKERLIAVSPYGDPTGSRGFGPTRKGLLEAKTT